MNRKVPLLLKMFISPLTCGYTYICVFFHAPQYAIKSLVSKLHSLLCSKYAKQTWKSSSVLQNTHHLQVLEYK